MRYQHLDLNLLVALLALLEERSVTRAAERIYVTQPTMSGMLSRLRDSFGDQLLVRVARETRLTPLAESLIGQVKEIVVRLDAITGTRSAFDPESSQLGFVIMASDYVSRILLAPALRSMAFSAPMLNFEIVPVHADMEREFEEGQIDLVIGPHPVPHGRHPEEMLFHESYKVLACASMKDGLEKRLTLDGYLERPHVLYQDRRGLKPWFESWFEKQDFGGRRKVLATNSYGLIPHFLEGTNRLSTVPERLAMVLKSSFDLMVLDLPMPSPTANFAMRWHKLRDQDPALKWVREQIAATAASL